MQISAVCACRILLEDTQDPHKVGNPLSSGFFLCCSNRGWIFKARTPPIFPLSSQGKTAKGASNSLVPIQANSRKDIRATPRLLYRAAYVQGMQRTSSFQNSYGADEHFRVGKEPPMKPKMNWEISGKSILFLFERRKRSKITILIHMQDTPDLFQQQTPDVKPG